MIMIGIILIIHERNLQAQQRRRALGVELRRDRRVARRLSRADRGRILLRSRLELPGLGGHMFSLQLTADQIQFRDTIRSFVRHGIHLAKAAHFAASMCRSSFRARFIAEQAHWSSGSRRSASCHVDGVSS